MNRKWIISLSIAIVFCSIAQSQTGQKSTLTLADCIEIALKNNLTLKSSELNAESSKVMYGQSRSNLLPDLNANYNLGKNDGRSIDPFTNDYINQKLTFSNAGLNLNATVFNGFRLLNSIKQNRYNMLASEMEIEENRHNLILEITLRYIQILNAGDLLELSKSRLETTDGQLNRLETLFKEEIGNPVNYTDMKGQYTLDQIGIITAENNLKALILELVKLLNLEVNSDRNFEDILGHVATEKYQISADEVYTDALNNLATFKSKELRIEAADTGIKVAKSDYFPIISFFGQLNTNYSSVAQSFASTGSFINETGDYVNINNQQYPVLREETQFRGSKINYNDQFNNNLNSVVGVSLRLPLFNGFRAKNNVALQKIQLEESTIELENTKLIFKQAIENAYNNMELAYASYHIQTEQVEAFDESFRVNEVRFNNGVSNIVQYITSKNNMDTARLNLNKIKYEYLLRVKILDYYRGI